MQQRQQQQQRQQYQRHQQQLQQQQQRQQRQRQQYQSSSPQYDLPSSPGKYLSEGAAREWSTVVDISMTPPSFNPVSLSLSRSPLSKTPKQVFFNPINILTLLPLCSTIINLLFRLTSIF